MQIEQLNLQAADLVAQQRFYAELLGLATFWDGSEVLRIQVGSGQLSFQQGSAPPAHLAFNIPPSQFEEARTWLAARTPLLIDSHGQDSFFFANWQAQAVYFRDPAGNILELIARQRLAASAPLPFGPQSLLNISEIGLAVDAVPAAVEILSGASGLAAYGDVSESFSPLGDEEGLLIVVQQGRSWFPDTGVAAEPLPLTATLRVAGQVLHLSGPPYRL